MSGWPIAYSAIAAARMMPEAIAAVLAGESAVREAVMAGAHLCTKSTRRVFRRPIKISDYVVDKCAAWLWRYSVSSVTTAAVTPQPSDLMGRKSGFAYVVIG